MYNRTIETINQAKEYFKFMGCSHFHMAREYPQRYEEYKRLNIAQQIEIEWIEERLEEYCLQIMDKRVDTPLWSIHSSIAELIERLRTERALIKMLMVTQFIRNLVPPKDRVIISETINGRNDRRIRSGLIYLAYDMNNMSIAKDFVELSLYFATHIEKEGNDNNRCQSAIRLCNEIKAELGL